VNHGPLAKKTKTTNPEQSAYIQVRTNQILKMENLTSPTNNIENTASLIMQAFRHFKIQANDVLTYEQLIPYLEKHDEHNHFKDVQRETEYHLMKEAYATPDASGLRLTPLGYNTLQDNK
jgi:hypothetical protein